MILLASVVYQFFAAMFVLFAVLFIIGFLWNARTMPPREFLGAGGVLIGLSVAAVIFLGMVTSFEKRSDHLQKSQWNSPPPASTEKQAGDDNALKRVEVPGLPRQRPSNFRPIAEEQRPPSRNSGRRSADQWWEENE